MTKEKTYQAKIVQIGHSKGIRIPKKILEDCHLEGVVNLTINERGELIISKPIEKHPFEAWAEAYDKKGLSEDFTDELIEIDDQDFDLNDWEWPEEDLENLTQPITSIPVDDEDAFYAKYAEAE